MTLFEKKYIFFVAATEKNSSQALIFQLPQYKRSVIVANTEEVCDTGGFLFAGYHDIKVMTTLKPDWSNLKMSL